MRRTKWGLERSFKNHAYFTNLVGLLSELACRSAHLYGRISGKERGSVMYHSILVPLDGSPAGEQALPLACSIAQQTSATLHLVHVHTLNDGIYIEGMPVIDDQLHGLGRDHEHAYLDQVRTRLLTNAALNIISANPDCDETVAHTLRRYSIAHANDLVVMTTHGRSGIAQFWLGSVADALLRITSHPLLLVHAHDGDAAAPSAAAAHILIPLDGSALAEQIIEPALALGNPMGAAYVVLQIVQPTMLRGPVPYADPVDLDPDGTQRRQAEAHQYLDAVAQRIQSTGASVTTMVRIAEHSAQAVLDAAQQHAITLIALATHGRSGFRRAFLGSTADKVVRGTTLPVLMYRPAGYET